MIKKLWYEPRKKAEKNIKNFECMMSEDESAVICGVLAKKKPKKILELGIAQGGTTAIMNFAIEEMKMNTQMYSVDISETYYLDRSKLVGYLARDEKGDTETWHTIFSGCTVADVIERIGSGIDFLLLDTMHILPGEILDLLAVFPYLSEDAIIVMHDVKLYLKDNVSTATSIIYNTFAKHRVHISDDDSFMNIGMLDATHMCKADMLSLASFLGFKWHYKIEKDQLEVYSEIIQKNYEMDVYKEFETALFIQKRLDEKAKSEDIRTQKLKEYIISELKAFLNIKKDLYLYGAGIYGKRFLGLFDLVGIKVSGFVISDSQPKAVLSIEGVPIYKYSEIAKKKDMKMLVSILSPPENLIEKLQADGVMDLLDTHLDSVQRKKLFDFARTGSWNNRW